MKKKSTIIAAVILVLFIAAAGLLYMKFKPETKEGSKKIEVTVIHGDGSEKAFSYTTDAAYLGEVLLKDKLIEGEQGPYGLYILTVDRKQPMMTRSNGGALLKAERWLIPPLMPHQFMTVTNLN